MAHFWTADSKAVANALLRHRHQNAGLLRSGVPISDHVVNGCTITYETLRMAAGIGGIARGVGVHLRKIRKWCDNRGFPPLDSFVVRKDERDPGEGFEGEWREDIRRCLSFQNYPKTIE
jgi:hypothetical protein